MFIPDLAEVFRQTHIFGLLSADEISALDGKLSVCIFQPGELVYLAGENCDGLHVVYSGSAQAIGNGTGSSASASVLNRGDIFGERECLQDEQRSQSISALTSLTVLRLSAADFRWFLKEFPRVAHSIQQRLERNSEFTFLRKLQIFSHLSHLEFEKLFEQIRRMELRPGEHLFEEGDAGDECYVVREGKVEIVKSFRQAPQRLAITKEGDLVGEMALLGNAPRIATAIALDEAVVLVVTREMFDRFIPEGGSREIVAQMAAGRLLQNEWLHSMPAAAETRRPPSLTHHDLRIGGWFSGRVVSVTRTETPLTAGLACLAMICRWYGVAGIKPEEIEARCSIGQPDDLLTISRKAEERGFLTRLIRTGRAALRHIPVPGLVRDADGILSVIYRVSGRSIVLINPVAGVRTLPPGEFLAKWDGQVLALTYIPELHQGPAKHATFLSRFWPVVRSHASSLRAIIVVSILVQICALAVPFFSKVIVDSVLVNGDVSLLYVLSLAMLLAAAIQTGAGGLREYLMTHTVRRMNVAVQLRFLNHVLRLPLATLTGLRSGDLAVRFRENDRLLQLISMSGFKIIVDTITILILILALFRLSTQLAMVASFFVAAYGALMLFTSPFLGRLKQRVIESRDLAQSYLVEAVSGIQTIKSLSAEDVTFQRGHDLISDLKLAEYNSARLAFNAGLVSTVLAQGATLAILGFGAMLALDARMTSGTMVAFLGVFAVTLAPLNGLVSLWDELQQIRISFQRTDEILGMDCEEQPWQSLVAPSLQGSVQFKAVSFRYPGNSEDVLSDVEFEILSGQRVFIAGRSGSGKTTLANLAVNLYQPSSGRICVDQIDLNNISRTALRTQIGYLEQHTFLFHGTVRENIAKAVPTAGLDQITAAATLAGAHEFIQMLPRGYDTPIGERGVALSGGQKQRIALARALLSNPRILILDEAMSALDSESEAAILRDLNKMMPERTVIIISHRLAAASHCDVVVVLDGGRLIEMGKHSQLLERRGLYYYLTQKSL